MVSLPFGLPLGHPPPLPTLIQSVYSTRSSPCCPALQLDAISNNQVKAEASLSGFFSRCGRGGQAVVTLPWTHLPATEGCCCAAFA